MKYAKYLLGGFEYLGILEEQEFWWMEGNGRTGNVSLYPNELLYTDKGKIISKMRHHNNSFLERAPTEGLEGCLTQRSDWNFRQRIELIKESDLDGMKVDIGVPSDEFFVANLGVMGTPYGIHAPDHTEDQVAAFLRKNQVLMVSYVFSVPEISEELISFNCD